AMKVLQEEQVVEVLQVLTDQLIHLDKFTKDEIKNRIKATQKETGIRGKKLFMPIRVAATGQTHGPELPMAMELLGKDIVITRLNDVLEQLAASKVPSFRTSIRLYMYVLDGGFLAVIRELLWTRIFADMGSTSCTCSKATCLISLSIVSHCFKIEDIKSVT